MKRFFKIKLVLLLVLFVIVTQGCTKYNATDVKTDESMSMDQNPFEVEKSDESKTTTLGSIGHGISNLEVDAQGDPIPLCYNGGEMHIEYEALATEMATKSGFVIYVDGMPQPYKVDSTEAPYEYMHEFEFADGISTKFTFIFKPITGKKGDTLEVCIASVFNPSFIPDMKETTSYGNYHGMLEAIYLLAFNKDKEVFDASMSQQQYLNNVCFSTEKVTVEQNEKYQENGKTSLDTQVFTELLINGTDVGYENTFRLEGDEKIHLKYKILGQPGIKYRSTLYINHQPIVSEKTFYFDALLTKGEVNVIDLDIDTKDLEEFNTFYIVSVPCNVRDFSDDLVLLEKTRSLLLYR